MDYQRMTLEQLKEDLIIDGKKGYPFFLAGALYWMVMGVLGIVMSAGQQLALFYIIGTGSIFPFAILIGKMVGSNLLSKNPLGVLGGIIGAIQAFYIPLWVVLYLEHYELVPLGIGLLGASHFLPYLWIYRSKSYLFFTIAMAVISFVFGYIFLDLAFSALPFLLAALYLVNVIGLILETKSFVSVQGSGGSASIK